MKKITLILSIIILFFTSCVELDNNKPTETNITQEQSDNWYYEVKVELTDKTDNGATIDINGTRPVFIIRVHNKNAFGDEISDVTNNFKLEEGDFKYYKYCEKYAQWNTIASYVKRYRVLNVTKKYY